MLRCPQTHQGITILPTITPIQLQLPKVHFISGLPRSGSTLLSAILRQNPRYAAAMSSPLAAMVVAMQAKMSGGEFNGFYDDATRAALLRGLFANYYEQKITGFNTNSVVFDSNRSWTARPALLAQLFPESRIICCVRDIGWIIDSIERMLAKNPLQLSRIFNFQPGNSVYSRVETLMNSETGLIGLPWATLRDAWFGEQAKRLIVLPYDHLVRDPKRTMERLYLALGEPQFEHDFNNVSYAAPDYDASIGMPGLHTIRQKIDYQERRPCIPPDIFVKSASTHFWSSPDAANRGVTLL